MELSYVIRKTPGICFSAKPGRGGGRRLQNRRKALQDYQPISGDGRAQSQTYRSRLSDRVFFSRSPHKSISNRRAPEEGWSPPLGAQRPAGPKITTP